MELKQLAYLCLIKRHFSCDKNVQDDTKCPDVSLHRVVRSSLENLRSCVRFGATECLTHVTSVRRLRKHIVIDNV